MSICLATTSQTPALIRNNSMGDIWQKYPGMARVTVACIIHNNGES